MYTNTVATPRMDLAGAIRAENQDLEGYIAHQILPPFPVDRPSANIPTALVTDDQVLSIKHKAKTAYQRVETSLGNASFQCIEAGIEEPMSAEDFIVLGQDRAEELATFRVRDIILRAREDAIATALTGATGEATFAGQLTTAANAWSAAAGTPIDDLAAMDLALGLRVGEGKRVLVIGQGVLASLQTNAQVRTEYRRIVGQTKAEATNRKIQLDALCQLLGVDEILVGKGRKNTAAKGQTAVKAFIWPSTYALLLQGVTNPGDLTEATLGRMFMWDGGSEAMTESAVTGHDALYGLTIESYRDEPVKSDIIRGSEYIDPKVLNVKCGQLIKSI